MTAKCRAQELDVVKLLVDLPEYGLSKGEEGTVLMVFGDQPEHYLVEFDDREGMDMPTLTVSPDQVEVVWSFAEHRPKEDQVEERSPEERAKLYFEQGLIYLYNGLLEQAKEKFCRALEIDLDYANVLPGKIEPLVFRDQWDEVASICRFVLSFQPDQQKARDDLAMALRNSGLRHGGKKKYLEALTRLYEVLEIKVSEEGIIRDARDCIGIFSNNLAVELAAQNRFEEAAKYFQAALVLSPDEYRSNWALFHIIWATFREIKEPGQFHESLNEIFNRALRSGVKLSEAYYVRGVTLANHGKPIEAVEALKKALNLDPQNEDASRGLAQLQEWLQKEKGEEVPVKMPLHLMRIEPTSQPWAFSP